MNYKNCFAGTFLSRPNRFVAQVQLQTNEVVPCHVKNTGRLGELLLPGASVWVQKTENSNRKTAYDLLSVYKKEQLVNIDSSAPNKVFREWVENTSYFGSKAVIKAEQRYGRSRFDFFVQGADGEWYIEVKGVTLEQDGVALFPDAPTQRGLRHVEELVRCRQQGYRAMAVFIIQMKGVSGFRPNNNTQPDFGRALAMAKQAGVVLLALDCHVDENSIAADAEIPVLL